MHVVGAVAGRAVGVAVAIVARQQAFERVDEVVIGPGAGLDDRDTGGGVRHEHVAQAVLVAAAEGAHRVGEVDDAAPGGVDIEYIGVHVRQPSANGDDASGLFAGASRVFHCNPVSLGGTMTITGIISAILIGIVVGVLGRLLVPGRQPIGMLVTILVGIVSAFIGTAPARAMGIPTVTNGIDWLELLVQVIVAALGVALGLGAHGPQAYQPVRRQAFRTTPVARQPGSSGRSARALICWTTQPLPSGSAKPNSGCRRARP